MIDRKWWIVQIEAGWKDVPIVWLSGVRRSGKTTLSKSLGEDRALYVNCDLPLVEDMLKDPVLFYQDCRKPVVIFDEIHQLRDPTRVLKIGADEFPKLRILATGSSTLAASRKFRDLLTGRKRQIPLLPVLWSELPAFGASLQKRLYHGGLPPALLATEKNPAFFREWMDSFFARDVQRLFGFRDIDKFNMLVEYLMRQSGGQLETSRTASALGISRPTVENHLHALEITHAIALVRPFFGGGQKELVKMPKCYGFDTGFVSFCRGWSPLRPDDLGILWEHVVLEWLTATRPVQGVRYWRDTSGHEIDFVIASSRDQVDAFECKWNVDAFTPSSLKLFRSYYPKGNNYLVCPLTTPAYRREYAGLIVHVGPPPL